MALDIETIKRLAVDSGFYETNDGSIGYGGFFVDKELTAFANSIATLTTELNQIDDVLPVGYRDINDVIREHEKDPKCKSAIDRARNKIKSHNKIDAERYRWLRHGDNDELIIQHGPIAPDCHWLPRNVRLDEMIDAAMKGNNDTI